MRRPPAEIVRRYPRNDAAGRTDTVFGALRWGERYAARSTPDPVMIAIDPPSEDVGERQRAALRAFLARAVRSVPLHGEISVLLTSDRELRRLNRVFRRKDRPTDVLSFPAADFDHANAGDLAISLDTARRQAKRQGHSLEIELKILLLHGLLHLAGYDHETDHGEMTAREETLRRRFRLPGGLTARGLQNSARQRGCRP